MSSILARLLIATAIEFVAPPTADDDEAVREAMPPRNPTHDNGLVIHGRDLIDAALLLREEGCNDELRAMEDMLATTYGNVACQMLLQMALEGGYRGSVARHYLAGVMSSLQKDGAADGREPTLHQAHLLYERLDHGLGESGRDDLTAFRDDFALLWELRPEMASNF